MFERHLDCIGRHFRSSASTRSARTSRAASRFNEPVAAITFDDGYRDIYEHAFPMLKRKGIPGGGVRRDRLVGRPFWQMHDKLYHLVDQGVCRVGRPAARAVGPDACACICRSRASHGTEWPRSRCSRCRPSCPDCRCVEVRRLMDGLEASVGNGFHNIPLTLAWPSSRKWQRGDHNRLAHEEPRVAAGGVARTSWPRSSRARSRQLGAHLASRSCTSRIRAASSRPPWSRRSSAPDYDSPTPPAAWRPSHPALTIERLLLWEGSSVDGDGQFSPAILNCQVQDLWPPARRCGRTHTEKEQPHG